MDTPLVNHLLQKHGVLKAFHISKVIERDEMAMLHSKLKLDDEENPDIINDKIQQALMAMSLINREHDIIPGVLNPAYSMSDDSLNSASVNELMSVSDMISDTLMDEGFTPKECIFILAATIKRLGLNPNKEDGPL